MRIERPARREVYAEKAISQIPRLLSLQDRNPFSPTYGCFHRDYWMYKTSDFPDAVRQFGAQALALVYKHEFPGNIYRGEAKVRDWAIAAINFWCSIQHKDGSFDEFYPYERGWVGPTAFTTYAITEAFVILRDEMSPEMSQRVLDAILRAARLISSGQSEEDHLANHHAMACLAVWKAYELLKRPDLLEGFDRLWRGFLQYHNAEEGWSREYDGADPGYLSATVSFLGKIYRTKKDPAIFDVLRQSAEFCSYFVYPNGFYAGSAGARNTLHFYPHGFEILSDECPIGLSIAESMLLALEEEKLVPPEIMSDRYVFYRVPEFLQAYLDYAPRPETLSELPFERRPFAKYFPAARILIANTDEHYLVANFAKGGVVKIFHSAEGQLKLNDCGLIGRLEDGRVITSQWIDPGYEVTFSDEKAVVNGNLNVVPTFKYFTPLKNLVFRAALVATGWLPALSHLLKKQIRKSLMLGHRPVPVCFRREIHIEANRIKVNTSIWITGKVRMKELSIGDEFFVRYVPQSRYFQTQELQIQAQVLPPAEIDMLNSGKEIHIERVLDVPAIGVAR